MAEPVFQIIPIMIRDGVRFDVRVPVDLTKPEAENAQAGDKG